MIFSAGDVFVVRGGWLAGHRGVVERTEHTTRSRGSELVVGHLDVTSGSFAFYADEIRLLDAVEVLASLAEIKP